MNTSSKTRLSAERVGDHGDDRVRPQRPGSTDSTVANDGSSDSITIVESRRQSYLEATVGLRWRGIIALVAGLCQQTLCWGMIMTFGSILTFYTRHLLPGQSKKAISFIGAVPPFFVLGLSLLWGRLLDAGHHRKVNTFAGICLTGGLAGLAFTGSDGDYGDGHYWQILLASVPIGIGQSCYFLAAPHMAKTWYPRTKGFAMGVTNCGAAVGGVAWPLIFTEMTSRYSFRAGIGTLAGISGVMGILIVYAATPVPTFQRRPIGSKRKLRTWVPVQCFRSKVFVVHIAAMCCVYLGILTVPFFIEYWAQQNGIGISEDTRDGMGVSDRGRRMTVYLVVILNACQLPGRLLGSTLCDKFQARKIHLLSCLMAVTIVASFWLRATRYSQGCTFAAMFGLTLGVMVSLPINDAAEILGPHRTHLLGQYAGVVYTIASPFILSGAVISGVIVDNLHNHAAGIWAISCFSACAVLLIVGLLLPDDVWKFDEGGDSNCQESCPEGSDVTDSAERGEKR